MEKQICTRKAAQLHTHLTTSVEREALTENPQAVCFTEPQAGAEGWAWHCSSAGLQHLLLPELEPKARAALLFVDNLKEKWWRERKIKEIFSQDGRVLGKVETPTAPTTAGGHFLRASPGWGEAPVCPLRPQKYHSFPALLPCHPRLYKHDGKQQAARGFPPLRAALGWQEWTALGTQGTFPEHFHLAALWGHVCQRPSPWTYGHIFARCAEH